MRLIRGQETDMQAPTASKSLSLVSPPDFWTFWNLGEVI